MQIKYWHNKNEKHQIEKILLIGLFVATVSVVWAQPETPAERDARMPTTVGLCAAKVRKNSEF